MIELCHRKLEQRLKTDENGFTTLTIENPHFRISFISDFSSQIEDDEGEFVCLKDGSEMSLKKKCLLLTDPMQILRDEKKEDTATIKELALSISGNRKEEFAKLSKEIIDFVENVISDSSIRCSIDPEFTIQGILKFASVKPLIGESSFLEKLASTIGVITHVYSKELVVICHLHSYLTMEDFNLFFNEMLKSDLKILLIEPSVPKHRFENERLIVIDEDLAEL